jgi:hypothetical protein
LEILKETVGGDTYTIGGVPMVISTLKMTFMDVTVEEVSKELLK